MLIYELEQLADLLEEASNDKTIASTDISVDILKRANKYIQYAILIKKQRIKS